MEVSRVIRLRYSACLLCLLLLTTSSRAGALADETITQQGIPAICYSSQGDVVQNQCAEAAEAISAEFQSLLNAVKLWKEKSNRLFQRLDTQLAGLEAALAAITYVGEKTTPTQSTTTTSTTTSAPPRPLSDCADYKLSGVTESGVHTLLPPGASKTFDAFCEITDRGVYTVFQRRIDGELDFYRDWDSYKNGFGNLTGEHWLGLDAIHAITSNSLGQRFEMVVDIWDWAGNHGLLRAPNFTVGDSASLYRLDVPNNYYAYPRSPGLGGGASGFRVHRGPFNTFDHGPSKNCAVKLHCGWWFINSACPSNANFNGRYYEGGRSSSSRDPRDGLYFPNINQSLKKITMKLRRM